MITSSSIQYISQVLAEPQKITEADKESIKAMIEAYPYFVPARYMDTANQHKKEAFSVPMMDAMQLYMGNWLMYGQFLHAAIGDSDVAFPEPETIKKTEEDEQEEPVIDEEKPHTSPAEPLLNKEASITDSGFVFGHVDISKQEPETLYKKSDYKDAGLESESDESLILPVYTEDYFLHQGLQVSNDIPADIPGKEISQAEEAKSLMIMMSFTEWLNHFKSRKEKEAEETQGQKAVKTMWQKEKLAAALEEENEEIPEKVFEMAVNSITSEDDLVSESLAEVHLMQGRHDKAIEMYRKLSLRNPQKKAYFARKIEVILKDK
jgi:tetratricopeptide (TPR) repeat protein